MASNIPYNTPFTSLLAQSEFRICRIHSEQDSEDCLLGHHWTHVLDTDGGYGNHI